MIVRIVDRSGWGTAGPYPAIVTVAITDVCPACGGPRGTPVEYSFYENGDTHTCDKWGNPCGHVDKYDDVAREYLNGACSAEPSDQARLDVLEQHLRAKAPPPSIRGKHHDD